MKRREITATGTINNDGRLSMFMGEVNEFFKSHRGERIFVRFSVAPRGSSEALKGYYYKCVVPTMRSAFVTTGERLTEEQTERRLRELSPVMYEETVNDCGKYESRIREISELSNAELIDHIDHIKMIAAEEFCTYIEDPNEI